MKINKYYIIDFFLFSSRICYLKLDSLVNNLKDRLDSKQKKVAAWKTIYNIKNQEMMKLLVGRRYERS